MPMDTPGPGRNDPCPCGNGRKYKHCCLAASAAEDAVGLRLRGAEGRLVPTLFERALEGWGKPFFMEAWEEFFLWKKRRADRLRREVAKRLGRDASFGGSSTQSVEALLAKRQAEAGTRASRFEERPPEPELDAEQQAALHEMMAGHWETWLDRRVPALGGKTPRQAAKTALGRERLDALLADYAWRAEEQPRHLRPDLDAIRRRLGLA